jgi:hypothetical protein
MDMNTPEQPRYSATPTVVLEADKPTGQQPWELFITEEHTEYYLTIKAVGDSSRGQLSGLGGWVFIGGAGLGLFGLIRDGDPEALFLMLGMGLPMFLIPFLWEVLRPLPLPILFNRRTREVYLDHDGELFHTPWDGITAVAHEFEIPGLTGNTRCASLEIRVAQFEQPEMALMASLGAPFGKSLAMQKGFWEYLRAYMNNGPWFDEQGNHSESDAFVKSQLAIRPKISDGFKRALEQVKEEKKEAGGSNYLTSNHVISLVLLPILYPMDRIQELTYSLAKRRSRNRWPSVVTERLKAKGPTTRLVDLECETGSNP